MDINMLDDYLEQTDESKQGSAETEEEVKLNDLFANINSIFEDSSQGVANTGSGFGSGDAMLQMGKRHAVIDKFRVQISIGSQISRIYDTSAYGYKIEYS